MKKEKISILLFSQSEIEEDRINIGLYSAEDIITPRTIIGSIEFNNILNKFKLIGDITSVSDYDSEDLLYRLNSLVYFINDGAITKNELKKVGYELDNKNEYILTAYIDAKRGLIIMSMKEMFEKINENKMRIFKNSLSIEDLKNMEFLFENLLSTYEFKQHMITANETIKEIQKNKDINNHNVEEEIDDYESMGMDIPERLKNKIYMNNDSDYLV